MSAKTNTPTLDRPWKRPGALRYALARAKGIVLPPVTVYEPEPGRVVSDLNVGIATRDGTVLRVNVYRPVGDGPFPTIMSAHPYGKDNLPILNGKRSKFSPQYRILRQPALVRFSTLTGWEAPDPAWWVEQGYAVINVDTRGGGTSDGVGTLFSDQEAEDYYDVIEWAGHQPWSNGGVGLIGVSYLGMSQYKVAGLKPPSLKAISPWEAMTDSYRDLMRPGGLYEHGFTFIWATATKRGTRTTADINEQQKDHPLRDEWWESITPDLTAIEVPMLICASFSDNNMHTRGSFRAFEHVSSVDRFAYTHRGGKWATFYGEPARTAQLAFFERYVRGVNVPPPPRVRLEVRESGDTIAEVRDEAEWPLARTQWTPLYLAPHGQLTTEPTREDGRVSFRTRREAAAFSHTFPADTELTGPMALRLWVSVDSGDDLDLYIGAEKWRGDHYVGFEGSYGYGRDRVTTGWQKTSLRHLDDVASTPAEPVPTFRNRQPLTPGEIVPVDIALGPSATLFRAGETLRLVIAGRWLWPRNPLTGQFPGYYKPAPATTATLHWGTEQPAHLLTPHIPPREPAPGA